MYSIGSSYSAGHKILVPSSDLGCISVVAANYHMCDLVWVGVVTVVDVVHTYPFFFLHIF